MNKVILMGRLTRDPEIRYSQGNDQMAIASLQGKIYLKPNAEISTNLVLPILY